MKKTCAIGFLALCIVSCGAKHLESKSTTSLTDSAGIPGKDATYSYSLDFNNKDRYLSYGSIQGKPFDTIMGPDTLWFFVNKKLVYTEAGEDSYLFYKNNTHWPKQFELRNKQYLFLVERSLGEPEGSDVVGFIFNDAEFLKKVEMKTYSWWTFQGNKEYSLEELKTLTDSHQL